MANEQIIDKALAYIGNDINARGWKLGGSATGANSITVPNTATELFLVANVGGSKYTGALILPTGSTRWEVGGYYLTSGDYGLCNCNLSNNGRTISLRNAYYGGKDMKSTSAIYVYYKTVG